MPFLIFLFVLVAGCVFNSDTDLPGPTVTISDVTVQVEIADDLEERRKGLMYRSELPQFSGMWFIFEDEKPRTFWMKNMVIPIDIIYISKDLEIVSIVKSAQPCEADPCGVYPSFEAVQYVLEVNAGFADRYNIQTGQSVLVDTVE